MPILEIHPDAAHVELTLNRPECRNALSRALIDELTSTIREISTDSRMRSVILTGAPPAFCAGLDLREVARELENPGEDDDRQSPAVFDNSPLLDLIETIEQLPQPVIAAVNGPALAGGAALVCACDLAVCAQSAVIGYPGIKRGLVAPLVMPGLVRLVGERHARFLLLTGESVSAQRASEMGLVNEVVPDREVLSQARGYAEAFAALPPQAIAQTKALLAHLRTVPADGANLLRVASAVALNAEAVAGLETFLGGGSVKNGIQDGE